MSLRTRLLIWFVAVTLLASGTAAISITIALTRRMSLDLSALGRDATSTLAAQVRATLTHTVSEFADTLDSNDATLPAGELLGHMAAAHREVACAAFIPEAPPTAAQETGTCAADVLARVRGADFQPAGDIEVAAGIPGTDGYLVPVRVSIAPTSATAGGQLFVLVDVEHALHSRHLFDHDNTFASRALVLDLNGMVLAHSGGGFQPQPDQMAGVPVELLDGRRTEMAGLLALGVTEGQFTLGGEAQAFTAEPVPDLGWVVIIATPLDTIVGLFRAAFGPVIPTLALALGISVLVWWAIAHHLTRGLAAMARAADRLAEADLSTPVPIPAAEELAMVARAMERMRQGLAGYKLSLLRTLMNALEARDEYTRGHSERVTLYAQAIGNYLRLPPADIQTLQVGGILHDVGKLGLDAALLRKPGRLTPAEWQEMQRHPAIGEQILQPLEPLRHVLPIVRSHHERLDGTGYPDGLSGSQIPLLARIVAVADCFDAMTSHRSYRAALSREQAIAELWAMTGHHLDATVVQALVSVLAYLPVEPAGESAPAAAVNLP